MMYVAYEYETMNGDIVRKLVTCKTIEEYRRVKECIYEASLKPITFDVVYNSKYVK